MNTLTINLKDSSYPIHIGSNLLSSAPSLIRNIYQGEKIALVTDKNVWNQYGSKFSQYFEGSGYKIHLFILDAGETAKNLHNLERLYLFLADHHFLRKDLLVAFGGGVIGDLAGFCAATYMRGIPFVQIPTTLLAQVDSSVGGKVAVNLPQGKNLVGNFYQPKMVIADTDLLHTLPKRELSAGIAEIIKYGMISNSSIYTLLEEHNINNLLEKDTTINQLVFACCQEKRKFVEKDEKDFGDRMILNFGHTFGHCIEKYYHYEKYLHGEAVAIGMVKACEYGEKENIMKKGIKDSLIQLLKQYDLPWKSTLKDEDYLKLMLLDKKSNTHHLTLILLTDLEQPFIHTIRLNSLETKEIE